jgi:hypothetical protein
VTYLIERLGQIRGSVNIGPRERRWQVTALQVSVRQGVLDVAVHSIFADLNTIKREDIVMSQRLSKKNK